MEPWLIAVIVVVAIVLILIISLVSWWISTGNYFRTTKVKIDESKSSIDVALTTRYDLLTKSLATVKGYSKHEYDTLTKVIALRNSKGISDMSMAEKSKLSNAMNEASKSINLVMEQYPDLKADRTFTKLQDQISDVEENLQASRRIFNSNVSIYNQKIVSFPASIYANSKGYTKEEFFEAEAAKKEDVKIEF